MAQFIRGYFNALQGSREYKLFIPTGHRPGASPLLLMLHGCHQDPDDFARGTRMNQHAQRHGFLVAYPEQAVQANGARCWNWYEAAHQQRSRGEPAIIADLTRHLVTTHDVAADQVFIAGFSAGGAMAATMAVIYPELYSALAIHSGVPHGAARDFMSAMIAMQHGAAASYAVHPMHGQIPTIVFHGDLDNMVHSTHAAQFLAQVPPGGYDTETGPRHVAMVPPSPGAYGHTRTVQFDLEQRIFSEHWMVHGGGHAWYGGDITGTYVDPNGPDASGEMVRFLFDRHE